MKPQFIGDICIRVCPSVSRVFAKPHFQICLSFAHSALCRECFSDMGELLDFLTKVYTFHEKKKEFTAFTEFMSTATLKQTLQTLVP